MSTNRRRSKSSTTLTLPPLPPTPFRPPFTGVFEELFSLYHATPLQNNPHILNLPASIPRNPSPPRLLTTVDAPQFGSFQGPQIPKFDGNDPPGFINNIDDYFDFYATPNHDRMCLRVWMEGRAANWLRWMRTNVLLHTQIPAVASSSAPPWIELPGDLTTNILHRLGAEGVLTAQKVCTTWWKLSKDPALWRVVDFSNPRQGIFTDKYNAMCRRAIDLSQGQLVDLTIQYFGDDVLMEYIAHRSPNLKALKLGTCFFISGQCAARMFPKLGLSGIVASDIEIIGKSCPMLKSFSCNGFKYILRAYNFDGSGRYYQNRYALAISNTMPNLQHLQLFAHWTGNKGLEAILNRCPHLESLDIRRCFHLDLEGDLGKRCSQKIKNLKLPNDSVSDVPWPNCDGGDPFSSSAFWFEYYDKMDYYNICHYNFS